jgi:NAD(P)H-dependent FMN reductase
MSDSKVPKIIAFAGSTRSGSFNQRLLDAAVVIARAAGAEVTELRLADYPLPLFDQDLEAKDGLPDNVGKLKQVFVEHSGLLIACPEYNSSITPLLKNTIDWLSRPGSKDEPSLLAYRNKTACLLAASPGGFGGLRGLRHVREILSNIGVLVTPNQFALSSAHSALDESGKLSDENQTSRLEACVQQFVQTCANQS